MVKVNTKSQIVNTPKLIVIIFAVAILLFLFFAIIDKSHPNNSANNESTNNNNVDIEATNKSESSTENFNDIQSINNYITNNNFTINGNANVRFSQSSNANGIVTINGGRDDLQGQYNIRGSIIYIYELKAISGDFDASINRGSSGAFRINKNGEIEGTLSSGQEYRNVVFTPQR